MTLYCVFETLETSVHEVEDGQDPGHGEANQNIIKPTS